MLRHNSAITYFDELLRSGSFFFILLVVKDDYNYGFIYYSFGIGIWIDA